VDVDPRLEAVESEVDDEPPCEVVDPTAGPRKTVALTIPTIMTTPTASVLATTEIAGRVPGLRFIVFIPSVPSSDDERRTRIDKPRQG
jgi:hypothetical protein